jgi:hypothetical protein
MVWFKVDDKFHSHNKVRKVLADDPAALALWVVAGSWSSDNLTDGFVPDHQLPWLIPAGADTLAQKLVTAGLWRRVRAGHQFHEWEEDGNGEKRNPTRAEVLTTRRKKAEAGRAGGLASGKVRSKPQAPAEASALADAEAPALGLVEPPTRPVPKTKNPPSPPRGKARKRYDYDTDEDFQRFWAAYPAKAGKAAAFPAWQSAIARGANPEMVIAAAERYRDDPRRNPDKTKYPQGWLNDERYLDQPATAVNGSARGWWDN